MHHHDHSHDPFFAFVVDLIERKAKDAELSDQLKHDLAHELRDQLDTYILRSIVEAIPAEKQDEFFTLEKTASDEELQNFVHTHVPELEGVVGTAVAEFEQMYMQEENEENIDKK